MMPAFEEEKKSDDGDALIYEGKSTFYYNKLEQRAAAAAPLIPKKTKVRDSSIPKVGVMGQSLRILLLDLPLLLFLSLYAGVLLLEYAKEDLFAVQYEGLVWDGQRRAEEITYYTRVCDKDDISDIGPSALFLPPNKKNGADIMMKHGFLVVPGVVQRENAAKLREYIEAKSKRLTKDEEIELVKNKNRYSFNLGTEEPGVVEVLEDLGKSQKLTETLESLLGPDPALIELNVITASYGAEDQHYHDDAVPDGSPSRYVHSFSPAYSLFVSLQNTTTKMGITSACPGTHFCSGGALAAACNEKGFQLANENEGLSTGDTFLFNMNSWHRGAAHSDPEGMDRVMLILSFTAKPKEHAESRQMVHGITYAMRWDMWGFTWNDLSRASSCMGRPWTYLRALGLYKPKDASWGLDYLTSSTMRAANLNNGFNTKDVANAKITWLPGFLRLTKDEIDDDVTNAWFWFCNDQIEKLVKFFKKACFAGLLTYISILSMLGLLTSQGFLTSSLESVRRGALLCALVTGIMYIIRSSVESTQWAKDLRSRRRFFGVMKNQFFFDEDKDGPHALPNTRDVLIENRFGYKDLGSYNDYIDYHLGNSHFLGLVDAVVPSYATYPAFLKEASAKYIAESVIADSGRFLEQGLDGRWHVADFETAVYFTKKTLISRAIGIVGTILKETRHLISDMRYGVHRNDDIAFLSAPFLKGLATEIQNVSIGLKTTPPPVAGLARPTEKKLLHAEDGVTVLRWNEPVNKNQRPLIKSERRVLSPPESRAKHVFRNPAIKFAPKEPSPGAWIVSGETIEANIEKHWYIGKIVEITAHGNHLIKFLDGEEGFYNEYQIRRFETLNAGERVQVFVSNIDDKLVYDDAIIITGEDQNNVIVEVNKTKERKAVPLTQLRRKLTEKLKKKPDYSYSLYG